MCDRGFNKMFRILLSFLLAIVAPAQVSAQFANSYGASGFTSGGASAVTPTTVSCQTRGGVPTLVNQVGAANVIQSRVIGFTNVDCATPHVEFTNVFVNTGISNGPQEIGTGSSTKLRVSFLYPFNATLGNTVGGYNQSATATPYQLTWNNVLNSVAGSIMKLTPGNPSIFVQRSFAQMQSDGGDVSGNQITVPNLYYVASDAAPGLTITADSPSYAYQMEQDKPPQQSVSAAIESGTTVTLTVPDTSRYITGESYYINGFIPSGYNSTSAGQPSQITVLNGTTVTYQAAAGLGAVTTLGTVRAIYAANDYAQATAAYPNPFGDIIANDIATPRVANNSANWSAVNTALTGNGQPLAGVVAVFGVNSTAHKMVAVTGDSLAEGVGDALGLGPGGSALGDSRGARGHMRRAVDAAGYSFVSTPVAGAKGSTQVTYNDGNVRNYVMRFASAIWDNMANNDYGTFSTYSAFLASQNAYWAQVTANGAQLVLSTTAMKATTVGGDNWTHTGPGFQTPIENWPTGYAWTNYRPDCLSGALPSFAPGAYCFDITQLDSNGNGVAELIPPNIINGYIAADGATAYYWTPDGVHRSTSAYIAIAAQVSSSMLATAFGFSP